MDKSDAESRASRLLSLREMSGLSRDKLHRRYGIARGTLQNWESARFGGLTRKGAVLILKFYLAEGIKCSLDWLLFGLGQGPSYISSKEQDQLTLVDNKSVNISSWAKEALFFRNNNSNAVDTVLKNDDMSPFFSKGDMVAGIKCYQDDIDKLDGKICIVQTNSFDLQVRIIKRAKTKKHYDLIACNLDAENYCQQNVEVFFAAEVIWVRTSGFFVNNHHMSKSKLYSVVVNV